MINNNYIDLDDILKDMIADKSSSQKIACVDLEKLSVNRLKDLRSWLKEYVYDKVTITEIKNNRHITIDISKLDKCEIDVLNVIITLP